jgi:hypothetical protein
MQSASGYLFFLATIASKPNPTEKSAQVARRKTANYRGSLGRRIDPWREDVMASLHQKLRVLITELGVDPDAPDADVRALHALLARHHRARIRPGSRRGVRHDLLAAASRLIPGFQMTIRGSKVRDLHEARHPTTRPTNLGLNSAQLVTLILAVRSRTPVNANGRRIGIKRSINYLTQIGQPFAQLRGHEKELELLYYRHRNSVPPALPSLALCARPMGQSCFGSDPFFDEVPDNCKSRDSCPLWKAYEVWASFAACEYAAELLALKGAALYRREMCPSTPKE